MDEKVNQKWPIWRNSKKDQDYSGKKNSSKTSWFNVEKAPDLENYPQASHIHKKRPIGFIQMAVYNLIVLDVRWYNTRLFWATDLYIIKS